MSQREFADDIAEMIEADHGIELSGLDLLDYMAIIGVEFHKGSEAATEYHEEVSS